MSKNRISLLLQPLLCLVIAWWVSSCSSKETIVQLQYTKKIKVAVLMGEEEQERWKRTARWALENIAKAQEGMPKRVELQLEFYNQDAEDIEARMKQIAKDTNIVAVAGPTTSASATLMAQKLNVKKAYQKPMITPSATQTEYQRKFANTSFVWNLAESDIAQLEVLLADIADNVTEEPVSLLTADESNDYEEWFGFIAEEYGVKVEGIYLYNSADDVRRYVRQLCGTDWRQADKALVFNPSDAGMALVFDEEIGKMKAELNALGNGQSLYIPNIYCSDTFVSDRIANGIKHATYKGVDLYAMPESGFSLAYRQHFGEDLINGEAQFYDALCLIAFAAVLSYHTKEPLNDAVLKVVDGRDGNGGSWLPADMRENFRQLAMGVTPDIDGVSSTWTFDGQTHSSVVQSTFRLWHLYNQKFFTTEYVSTEGSKRTSSSKSIWNWKASLVQNLNVQEGSHLTYPQLDDQWALLIAASKGWENYRFQADVFAIYEILKQHGYHDDHILLVCEDDLAYSGRNAEQGIIRITDTGDNLYHASSIDYKLGDLSPKDLGEILQGKRSERLPHVIEADSDDNVFVFWSGHGMVGSMDFGGRMSVSYQQMKEMLADTPHRKLLFAVESCYSGGLGEYCTGLPGTLFITAASPYETSHADVWSKNIGVFRSNSFTKGFQKAVINNADISLRELYYTLARTTTGSHVKVYNARGFGSLYDNSMGEFIISRKK